MDEVTFADVWAILRSCDWFKKRDMDPQVQLQWQLQAHRTVHPIYRF